MKKFFTLIFFVLVISGCAIPRYNYVPPAGEATKGILVNQPASYNHPLGGYVVEKGYYRLIGDDGSFEFYLPTKGKSSGELIVLGVLDKLTALAKDKTDNIIYVVTEFNLRIEVPGVSYEVTNIPQEDE